MSVTSLEDGLLKKNLRFGLVGCGRIGARHAALLSQKKIPNAELVAVCDTNEARAQQFANEYSAKAYTKLEEMLAAEQLDVLSILTPSGLHSEHTIQSAPYVANIVVEKPMALTIKDADAMIECCDAHSTRLFVVKQNRFNMPVRKLRRTIDQGRFGKIFLGTTRVRWTRNQSYYDQDKWRGTWKLDGGVLANQASHHIDLLLWMMGDVDSVFARSTTDFVDVEVETTAIVSLKFSSGALGLIEATTAARPVNIEGSLSILGEKGSAVVGGFAVNKIDVWKFEDPIPEEDDEINDLNTDPPDVYGFGHKVYYEHVIKCIRENGPNLVDGLEGRRSLELISAIYESIETGTEVNLRFQPKHSRLGL